MSNTEPSESFFAACPGQFYFGGVLNTLLSLFLLYVVFVYFMRALLGEKIFKDSAFWFYLSMALYTLVYIPYFLRLESLCQISCYSYFLLHGAMRTSTIMFVFHKLELFKPDRLLQGTPHKSLVERICGLIVCTYMTVMIFRFISRFFNDCYGINHVGGCLSEADPIFFFHNIPEVAMIFCEAMLLFRLIRAVRMLYSEHNWEDQNMWFEQDVVSKMWWYVSTSLVALTTNMIIYFGLMIFKSIGGFRFGVDYCHWTFFLNIHTVNMAINTMAISCCFPLRSINIFYVLKAIRRDNRMPALQETNSELTPEQLNEFVELERMKTQKKLEEKRKIEGRQLRRKGTKLKLDPGRRLIQNNWEKCPLTGKIIHLPSMSPSPTETDDEESSTGLLLHIPTGNTLSTEKNQYTPSESGGTDTTLVQEDLLRELTEMSKCQNLLVGDGLFEGTPENPLAE